MTSRKMIIVIRGHRLRKKQFKLFGALQYSDLDGFVSTSGEEGVFVVEDVDVANAGRVAGERLQPDLLQIEAWNRGTHILILCKVSY